MFVATVAGVIGIGAFMAGDALDVVFTFVIDGEGVHHQLRGNPSACGVATLAIDPKLPRVNVRFGVTIHAVAGQATEYLLFMAVEAINGGVCVFKREDGTVVKVGHLVNPIVAI